MSQDSQKDLTTESSVEQIRNEVHQLRQVNSEYEGRTWVEIQNRCFEWKDRQRKAGDYSPDWLKEVNFYKTVYPDFGLYVESKVREAGNDEIGQEYVKATNDYLMGADLLAKTLEKKNVTE